MDTIDSILDELTERIGKIRDQVITDLKVLPSRSHGSHNHNYLLGYDRGLFLALLEIADMKRRLDESPDSDLDTDHGI